MCVHFETDATAISARYTLARQRLAGANMTAIGASGLDLYTRDAAGRWRWAAGNRPQGGPVIAGALHKELLPGRRTYRLYLPLYNGVESLEIGVPRDTAFTAIAPRSAKPIVFYGTSITQGASASRPGMAYAAILGRRLNLPTINLGFSGNGKMEPEMADLLAELDPAAYVIDCVPNMDAKLIAERAEPLVSRLRKAHPDVPIVLVEDRSFTNAAVWPRVARETAANRAALRKVHDNLLAAGMTSLEYAEGESLFGDDGEAATDGDHPSDLGMVRIADVLETTLAKLRLRDRATEAKPR